MAALNVPRTRAADGSEVKTDLTVRQDPIGCGCGAMVVFARTKSGAQMPLNATPDPTGNVAAHRDGLGVLRARVLKKGERKDAHEKLARPHRADNCGHMPGQDAPVPVPRDKRAEASRARRAAREELVAEQVRQDDSKCPLCTDSHGSCTFRAGSLYCVDTHCTNPHHRRAAQT